MGLGSALTAMTRAFRDPELTRLELRTSLESPSVSLVSPAAFAMALGIGEPTASGEMISEASAINNITTVYACVKILSEAIGTLPMRVYAKADGNKTEALDHSLTYIVGCQPSPDHTPPALFEALVANMALTGNGYLEITRDRNGIVSSLYPLNSLKTSPVRQPDGTLIFETTDGMTNGQKRLMAAEDVIHVPLFSLDGLKGLSPISSNRQSIGLSQATLKLGARRMGNGSNPGGIITMKTPLSGVGVQATANAQQVQQIREAWEKQSSGVNSGRIAVLPADMQYTPLGMSLADSQYLASRAFSRAEIASIWGIPPYMVGDTDHMSNANFEQSSLSLLQTVLQPYIRKIEAEFNRKLLAPTARTISKFSLEFDLSERLRTDQKSLLDSIALARQWGVYSINDSRRVLGQNPIGPEGDVYNQPSNMMNATLFETWTPQKATGATTPPVEVKSSRTTEDSYQSLIRDALGRLTKRTNRSSETFAEILGPLYMTIIGQLLQEALSTFALPLDWQPATEKLLKDCLASAEHRSKSWDTASLDEIATTETNKAYRSLRINLFREAGAALAIKE